MSRAALVLIVLIGSIVVFAACGHGPTSPDRYTLEVVVSPDYSGGAVALDPSPNAERSYSSGTTVKLQASPAVRYDCKDTPYWAFTGWSGDIQGSASTAEVIMDSNKSINAGFKEFFPQRCPTPPPTCEKPTLEISVDGDTLRFDPDQLQAAAGTEVPLCFKNVSSAFQHNWVLVKAGTKDAVVQRGSQHPENGWVQPGDPEVITRTKLLDPGQEAQVGFTAPPPGNYEFVCTFPGHSSTMMGEFVVTP